MIGFCQELHARGFRVEIVTPAMVSVHLLTGDILYLMVGKGNKCSNEHAIQHHAPDSLFSASTAEVGFRPYGERVCTERRFYQTTEQIWDWIAAIEK